jgi:hypothetical protein
MTTRSMCPAAAQASHSPPGSLGARGTLAEPVVGQL